MKSHQLNVKFSAEKMLQFDLKYNNPNIKVNSWKNNMDMLFLFNHYHNGRRSLLKYNLHFFVLLFSYFADVAIYIKTILFSLIEVIFLVMRFIPFTLNSNK